MKSLGNRLVLFWMLATVLHLPFPVVGGEDLRYLDLPASLAEVETPATLLWQLSGIDIDYILIGCPVPGDVDSGPIDTAPRNDVQWLGAFPLFVKGELSDDGLPTAGIPLRMLPSPDQQRLLELTHFLSPVGLWQGAQHPCATRSLVLRC